MHKIKEMLMKELYEYEEKAKKMAGGKMSAGDLETLHKLTDTVKNLDKIEMMEAEGYSEDTSWMGDGHIYGTSYEGGGSYARGRRGNVRRDSMGRYSRERGGMHGRYSQDSAKDHMLEKLEEMMDEVHTERERKAIQRCMDALEES